MFFENFDTSHDSKMIYSITTNTGTFQKVLETFCGFTINLHHQIKISGNPNYLQNLIKFRQKSTNLAGGVTRYNLDKKYWTGLIFNCRWINDSYNFQHSCFAHTLLTNPNHSFPKNKNFDNVLIMQAAMTFRICTILRIRS